MAVHAEGPLATGACGHFVFSSCNRKKQLAKRCDNSQAVKKGAALCKMAGIKKS